MKKINLLMIGILCWQTLPAQEKILGFKPELSAYVDFIQDAQVEPIPYLLNQLNSHDVLVFGERDHRDITQYYFLEKLINTEEFYKQVSIIYTEVGSSNYNDTLNKILHSHFTREEELDQALIKVYRDISYQVFWEKYNFFYLWKTIYRFNQSHPDYPLSIHMTSRPFDWNEMQDTSICNRKTSEVEKYYDESMAESFLASFEKNRNSVRNKAFVIMNYPHSLRKWTSSEGESYQNFFGSYVDEKLGNRVCFVIVNPYIINTLQPTAKGKWDAAFKYCKYKTIGFDFQNTPFGKDTFDIWWEQSGIDYESLYDGMIYINPASECENILGIPGFLDNEFAPEYMRRLKLRMYAYRGEEYKTKLKWEKEYCNKLRTRRVQEDIDLLFDKDKSKNYEDQVNQWLVF